MVCSTLLTRKTNVGVMEEVTEGIYLAPTNTDLIQVNGFPGITPTRELIDRDIIRDAIGRVKPLLGLRAGTLELQTEFRGGGETASVSDRPEAFKLYKGLLGSEIDSTVGGVTIGGSTDTLIELGVGEVAAASMQRGTIVMILGEVRYVVSVLVDQLTLNSALDKGAPAGAVTVFGGFSYAPVTADHPPLSITIYEDASVSGPEFRGIGCRVSNGSFADFTTGQIAKITFTLEMLNWTKAIGTVPASPVFNPTLPRVLIGQFAEKDGVRQQIQTLECTIANTVARVGDLTEEGGTACMRVTDRVTTGSYDPFQEAANNDNFDEFDGLVSYEMLIAAGERVPVTGEFTQGTVASIWFPQAITTEYSDVDNDGIVINNLPFQAHTSVSGGDDDVFFGFI